MKQTGLLKRILALLGAAALIFCAILTVIFAVTGNPNFMGMLLLTLFLPILLWVFLYFHKLLKDRSNDT